MLRIFPVLLALFLVACSPKEPEVFTTSVDVDDAVVTEVLSSIDGLTENDLPINELLELTDSVPMDEEKQLRVPIAYRGENVDMLYHVWREQADWVHVYAMSTSKEFVDAVAAELERYRRADAE